MNTLIPTVLHIGAPKCGSSALQSSLTNKPFLKATVGSDSFYAAIRGDGSVLSGKSLQENANTNPWGYVSSVSAKHFIDLPGRKLKRLKSELSALSEKHGKLILSNEGWLGEYDAMQRTGFLTKLGLDCTVIIYIRNPVDWINSAWWQWGAWTDVPFGKWLKKNQSKASWYDLILPWSNLEGVGKVIVKILPTDIVSDFCSTLMLKPIKSIRSNSKLPSTILRLYQRNRFLRKTAHDSAIDFILSKHFGKDTTHATPWVLGPIAISNILTNVKESNMKLLDIVEKESAEALKADLRWWSPDAFANKTKEPLMVKKLPVEKLEIIAANALQALYESERELLNCKKLLNKNGK